MRDKNALINSRGHKKATNAHYPARRIICKRKKKSDSFTDFNKNNSVILVDNEMETGEQVDRILVEAIEEATKC